ncbi:hypothetical protein [Sagittula sp.]|uniref:hypothetical protein n=1 Tax=Sagittula sp. TaxID=2038081 RepID=UPI00405889F0
MAHETTGYRLSPSLDLVLKVMVTAPLLCISVITFVDVIGRYFFNARFPAPSKSSNSAWVSSFSRNFRW